MHKPIWATALPALTILALLATSTVQAQDTEGWPDWLQKAMAEETRKLKFKELDIEDGPYRFEVAGKPTEPEAFDGGWYISSKLGKSSALFECYIFSGDTDLATLAVNLTEIGIEATGEANNGAIGNRNMFALDAGHIDGAPYLAIEWVFTIGEAPNAVVGFSKVRAATNGQITQACSHNTPGYRETFQEAFETFVRSTKQPQPDVQPYYEELSIQELDGQAIGTATASYSLDADGDTLIQMTLATLYPIGPDTVTSSDSSTTSWSTSDGYLINSYSASAENGELVTNLSLARNEDDDWHASGTFQGKELSEIIDGAVQPLSDLGQMQLARDLFAGDDTTVEFPVWVADADPSQILQGSITRNDAETEGQGILTLGPLSVNARFDELGAMRDADMQIGPSVIRFERIWHRGAPQ